jgi:hypothetical protein
MKNLLCETLLLCAMGTCFYQAQGQTRVPGTDSSSAQVVLDVINQHVTGGYKVPSLYLRVFSNRSVECHAVRFMERDADATKKKTLTAKQFEQIKKILDQTALLNSKRRYELVHPVFDSWMEWDITIQHSRSAQEISVASFVAPTALGHEVFYPDAVARLGCLISRLRDEVYGDEHGGRRRDCERIERN